MLRQILEQIGICLSALFNAAGNEFTVGHNYDSLDRETSRSYYGATKFYWTYNVDGNLARCSENGNRVLTYLYDDIGRLLQVSGNDGSYVKTSYDKLDKSTNLHHIIKSAVASRTNTLALSFWSGSASFTLGCGIPNRVSCLFLRWFK